MKRWVSGMLVALAVGEGASMVGCAALRDDRENAHAMAVACGMRSARVVGDGLQHQVFLQGDVTDVSQLHVYLEGDGLPWVSAHLIAADPTPRNPLALRLMARDPEPAIYLGRPCYFGLAHSTGCSPWLWTYGRYSDRVVASMAAALRVLVPRRERQSLTLIGYSGGGVLAVLLAERLGNVAEVVTVAANLDIDAWADQRGYSRLAGSLNPAVRSPLEERIRQVHWRAERDTTVPPASTTRYLARNPGARVVNKKGFDHRCCWVDEWPRILAEVQRVGTAPHLGAEPQ